MPIAAIGLSEFTAFNRTVGWLFNPAVKFNRESDFTHIGLVGNMPMVLVARPKTGLRSVTKALNATRKPDGLCTAWSGIGTMRQVAGELPKQKAGTQTTQVPCRGATQVTIDVTEGNIEPAFSFTPFKSCTPAKRCAFVTGNSRCRSAVATVPRAATRRSRRLG